MTEYQSVPHFDSAGFNHSLCRPTLSSDGANNLTYGYGDCEPVYPISSQFSQASRLGQTQGLGDANWGLCDSFKVPNNSSEANFSAFSSMLQNGHSSASGATNRNFAPGQVGPRASHQVQTNNFSQMMDPKLMPQFAPFDAESLQQKIFLKKQSLDILQGVLPDPLEPNYERRYMTNTERIQVPSSDHVAEIVGKNGQRIKQLREQLKVWVKTPSRDEPPIFEVTGMPDKLAEAKKSILSMSEHFTKVQQDRLLHRTVEANRIEDRLYVDQDKVGLIVGASGQTIRWVQQLSDTHIATPRKQETIPGMPPLQTFFTISGSPERVKLAKQLICEYVTMRCQGLWLDPELEPSAEASQLVRDFHQKRQDQDQRLTHGGPPAAAAAAAAAAGAGAGDSDRTPHNTGGIRRDNKTRPTAPVLPVIDNVRQLISEMDNLWNSMVPAPAAAKSAVNSSASSSLWNPMMYTGAGPAAGAGAATAAPVVGGGDRRFSAADVAAFGGDFVSGLGGGGGGFDNPHLAPSDLQQQQQQQLSVGPGWM